MALLLGWLIVRDVLFMYETQEPGATCTRHHRYHYRTPIRASCKSYITATTEGAAQAS
jgi:hypothetical protein